MQIACPKKVASTANSWFLAHVPAKKHSENECTVFSALVGFNGIEYKVLSAGTGTKCVGLSGLCDKGYVLADSHAEIICRRAFLRYLYHDLNRIESDFFDVNSTTNKRCLKDSCQIHLYISEAPCGDGALYDVTKEALEDIHQAKLKKRKLNEEIITVPCRTTGAKEANTMGHSNTLGLARVKSGRSDILPRNRTVSMSCSDKICKWLACGLQGTLFAKWYEPILLHGIVISRDPDADSASFQDSLQRSLRRSKNSTCSITSIEEQFSLSKNSTRSSSSGLSLNWSLIDDDLSIEYTLGARGVRMGAKKKLDLDGKRKMCSRLCRRRFFELVLAKEFSEEVELSYNQLKETRRDHIALKESFYSMECFLEWRGVPTVYNEFVHQKVSLPE